MRRRLGRSGIDVGAVGLGCWAIGGPFERTDGTTTEPMGWGAVDDAESIRAVHRALDLGVTLFDTANNYGAGHSERILGRALAGRRDDAVIVTKFGSVFDEQRRLHFDDRSLELTEKAITEACEASLRRLATDVIDVYLLHDGEADPERAAAAVPVLERLVDAGKIRAYGWSTDDPARARVFAAGEHCTAIEYRLSLTWDNAEMVALCEEQDLASIVKQPLNSGVLTGKFTRETRFAPNDGRRDIDFGSGLGARRLEQLEQLRAATTLPLVHVALAWVLSRSPTTVPVPGFKTVAQVEELAAATSAVPLPGPEREAIAAIF